MGKNGASAGEATNNGGIIAYRSLIKRRLSCSQAQPLPVWKGVGLKSRGGEGKGVVHQGKEHDELANVQTPPSSRGDGEIQVTMEENTRKEEVEGRCAVCGATEDLSRRKPDAKKGARSLHIQRNPAVKRRLG